MFKVIRKGIVIGFTEYVVVARIVAIKDTRTGGPNNTYYKKIKGVEYFTVPRNRGKKFSNLKFGNTLFWTINWALSANKHSYSYRIGKMQKELAKKYRREAIRSYIKQTLGSTHNKGTNTS